MSPVNKAAGKEPVTALEGLEKAMHFCSYRERCHAEVRKKVAVWPLPEKEKEWIIARLIEEGFLNEERYARAYCRGKFRINHWGRNKILRGLKMNNIGEYCIRKGMEEITAEEYREKLAQLAQKKWESLSAHVSVKKRRTAEHLIRKGYEYDLVWDEINELAG